MFLLLSTCLWANPGDSFLRMNIPQLAREYAEGNIEKNPNSPNSHAQLAIALCRLGHYSDALPHFIFGQESTLYPIRMEEYHADTLRYLYRVEEAISLREELLLDYNTPVGYHPRIMSGMIDDYRTYGRFEEAFDIAYRLMSKHPNAALSYAMMAELYIDIGDLEEAFFYLWRGEQKTNNIRTEQVYARYLLVKGYPEAAEQYIQAFFEQNVRNSLLSLYAKTKLKAYGPQKALVLLDRNKFINNKSPDVLWIRMNAYQELGKTEEYQEVFDFLNSRYPEWMQYHVR